LLAKEVVRALGVWDDQPVGELAVDALAPIFLDTNLG